MGMVYLPTFVVGFIVAINYRVGTYIHSAPIKISIIGYFKKSPTPRKRP